MRGEVSSSLENTSCCSAVVLGVVFLYTVFSKLTRSEDSSEYLLKIQIWVVNTQWDAQMMYYSIAHLKPM